MFLKILFINLHNSQEQAMKEAEAKAAREAYEAKIANCSEEERAALELAAATAAAVAKSKKVKSRIFF